MLGLKQAQRKPLTLRSLPKRLQEKYKNSIIFQKQNQKSKKYKFDPQKIRKRKTEKQKTIQQKLKQYQINPTQLKHLYIVFDMISNKKNYFGFNDIENILKCMSMQLNKADIDQMIWQFDQDLDKKITKDKLIKMYKKCKMDKAAAQPKKLFHLTQFLMYCRPGYYRVTVEDTLQLLYVRALEQVKNSCNKSKVQQIFQDSIKVIFGEDYQKNNSQGVQKDIGFSDYLQKINKKAIQKRKSQIEKIKSQLKYS